MREEITREKEEATYENYPDLRYFRPKTYNKVLRCKLERLN